MRRLAALAFTISLGLMSRLCPIGWPFYDKSLGDVLYAIAAYLFLALVLFRVRRAVIILLAFGLCIGIECFKTTGIPALLARDHPLVGWLIGTTFSWHNLVCYGVGVAIIAAVDVSLLRPPPIAKEGCTT
jgi:uncharacterized protein DUF2809